MSARRVLLQLALPTALALVASPACDCGTLALACAVDDDCPANATCASGLCVGPDESADAGPGDGEGDTAGEGEGEGEAGEGEAGEGEGEGEAGEGEGDVAGEGEGEGEGEGAGEGEGEGEGDTGGEGEGEGEGEGDLVTPRIFALHPATASAGQHVVVEGRFGAGASVVFPSGLVVGAAGAARLEVTVPAGAGSGTLIVDDANGAASIGFRAPSFVVTPAQVFFDDEVQADNARAAARLPANLVGAGAVVVDNHVFVVGGTPVGAAATGSTEVLRARIFADGTLSRFVHAGSLVVPREGPAVVVAGDRIVVAGGENASVLPSTESAVVAADGSLGAFLAGPDLPGPRAFAAAVVVGGAVVVAGGEDGAGVPHTDVAAAVLDDSGAPVAFVDAGTALGTARSRFGLVVERNHVIALGGLGVGGAALPSTESAAVDGAGAVGAFAARAPLSLARSDLAAFAVDGVVCAAGGRVGATPRKELECTRTDGGGDVVSAFAARADLPSARAGSSAVVTADRVWLVGGGATPALAFLPLDDGAKPGAFAAAAALASPARDLMCAVVADQLYAWGGIGSAGVATTVIQRAPVAADGSLGAFALVSGRALSSTRRAAVSVVVDDAVIIAGGQNSAGQNLAGAERFAFDEDGNLAATATSPTLIRARRGARAAVIDDTVFVVGGRGQSGDRLWERASLFSGGALGAFSEGTTSLTVDRGFYVSAVAASSFFALGSGTAVDVESERAVAGAFPADFTVVGRISFARENGMATFAGGKVWALGGFTGAGDTLTVEAAAVGASGLGAFNVDGGVVLPAEVHTGACAVRAGDFVHLVGGSTGGVLAATAFSAHLATP